MRKLSLQLWFLCWLASSIFFAMAVAFATQMLLDGLPPDTRLKLWAAGPEWLPTTAGNRGMAAAAGFAVLAVLLLVQLALLGIWKSFAAVAEYVLIDLRLSSPARESDAEAGPRAGLQSLVALVVVAGVVGAVIGNALLLDALVVAALVIALVVVMRAVFFRLGEMRERFTIRNRVSAIGGGQGEWEVSQPLVLLFLAAVLAGGVIGLTAIALRPPAQNARTEEPPKPDKTGRTDGSAPSAPRTENPAPLPNQAPR